MNVTRPSTTSATTFDEVIRRLRVQEVVDGLMVVGSAARGELRPASDYDLVIVISDMPVQVDLGATVVDGRNTDLLMLSEEELDETIESSEPVNPYTFLGRVFLRMADGRIELDRSGRLEKAKQKLAGGVPLKLIDAETNYLRWWMMNGFLRLNKRLAGSDDPVYVQAAELGIMGMLNDVMSDYFNFREILFKGEKDTIRHWAEKDPEMMSLFMECLKEPDTHRKIELFEKVAARTTAPIGDLWKDGTTSFIFKEGTLTNDSDVSDLSGRALDFWEELVASPSAGK